MYRKNFPILAAILFLFLFCTKKNENQDRMQSPDLYFDVDSTEIGRVVLDSSDGLRFNPPKGWEPVSPDVFSKLKNLILHEFTPDQKVVIDPFHVFLEKDNESLLAISYIRGAIDTVDAQSFMTDYVNILTSKFGPDRIRKGSFTKDGIYFFQFLIRSDNRVIFKLIFSNTKNHRIQFDYIVSKTYYPLELKAIESSIGSIQLMY